MVMKVLIRLMEEKDIQSVQQVAQKTWYDTYEGIIPRHVQHRFLKSAYQKKTLQRRMKHDYMVVAEVDRQVVGFAHFSMLDLRKFSLLNALYILPEFQNSGIGSKLLEAGISYLEQAKMIYLYVEKNNEKAIQFYKRKGFESISETRENFIGYPLYTLQMKLTL